MVCRFFYILFIYSFMARRNDYINKIDKLVGDKMFSLRLSKGLSRQQLSEKVGVTHQQLQKYEKGTNRIAVGRLILIAEALEVDPSYFYQDLKIDNHEETQTQHQRMCLEVSRNFMKIANPECQNAVNDFVKTLSKIAV
jgi:transcriptional regulator with XRE-family HTH domain